MKTKVTFSRILASLITACAILGIAVFAAPYFIQSESKSAALTQGAFLASSSAVASSAESKSGNNSGEKSAGVLIPGSAAIRFIAGQIEQTVSIYNPSENIDYLIAFELKIMTQNGEYESLLKTEKLSAGEQIQTVQLSKPLFSGTYDGIMTAQPYYKTAPEIPTGAAADMNLKVIVQ